MLPELWSIWARTKTLHPNWKINKNYLIKNWSKLNMEFKLLWYLNVMWKKTHIYRSILKCHVNLNVMIYIIHMSVINKNWLFDFEFLIKKEFQSVSMEIGNENYNLVNNKKSIFFSVFVQYSCWILVSRKMLSTHQGINIKKLRHKMNANENKQFLCMRAV